MPRSYKDAALSAYVKYSTSIFPAEEAFLEHLFFVNGNGYEWFQGTLVCDEYDDPREKSSYDEVPPISFLKWKEEHCYKDLYPLCQYADCLLVPDNVQPDWLEALGRALDWADSANHHQWEDEKGNVTGTSEERDHEWLKVARDRYNELVAQGRRGIKVGISLGDNDFYICVTNFLSHMIPPFSKLTKELVANLFNNSISAFYLAYQCTYQGTGENQDLGHIKEYLNISPDQVYLGDEVDAYIKENGGWCNGEFFVYDDGTAFSV